MTAESIRPSSIRPTTVLAVMPEFSRRLAAAPGNERGKFTKTLLYMVLAAPTSADAFQDLAAMLDCDPEWVAQVYEKVKLDTADELLERPTPEKLAYARSLLAIATEPETATQRPHLRIVAS